MKTTVNQKSVDFCQFESNCFGYKSWSWSRLGVSLVPSGVGLAHQSDSHVYLSAPTKVHVIFNCSLI